MAPAVAPPPAGLLLRKIATPESLQRAGDWVLAATVLVAMEWRAILVWALAIGLPYSLLTLATAVQHTEQVDAAGAPRFLVAFTLFLIFEPLAGGAAYRFLKARADGETLSLAEIARHAAARFVPLAAFQALVEIPIQTTRFFLSLLFSPGPITGFIFLLVGYTAHALVLTTPPLVALDGMNPLRALHEGFRRARSRLPVYVLTYFAVGVIHGALWVIASSPDVMANTPTCAPEWGPPTRDISVFCSVWWRPGYSWLKTAATAPFYALAFIAYLEAGSRVSTVEPADGRDSGRE